jgi:hypothetical protein
LQIDLSAGGVIAIQANHTHNEIATVCLQIAQEGQNYGLVKQAAFG